VQAVVQEKKKAFKKCAESKNNDYYKIYKSKKSASKVAVAKAKAVHFDELYNNPETPEGAKKIYRLAATRHTSSLDIGQVKNVRSDGGQLLRARSPRNPGRVVPTANTFGTSPTSSSRALTYPERQLSSRRRPAILFVKFLKFPCRENTEVSPNSVSN